MLKYNDENKEPCIICVALTGSLPKKINNKNIPISVNEQIESAHKSFEAGATIAHCHVRNEDESISFDPEKFLRLKEGIRKHCYGMVIQFSTGGRYTLGKERGGMLSLCPDMASLSVGSNNEEFVKNSGWLNSKNSGKMRVEGKDYIVKDGDVMHFLFNV